jgi:3-phosphoshikimate 1-carboxyvinyltransferase
MTRSIAYREIEGAARAPASKSSMQRAVACALLAGGEDAKGEVANEGKTLLRSPSRSADCLAALAVAKTLGATIEDLGDSIRIRGLRSTGGISAGPGSSRPLRVSCGESGLCIRMFSPIAALFARETELRAEGTLTKRPLGSIEAPLLELGAECRVGKSGLPPVSVRGPLRGGRARVDGRGSSQFLTGLLIALPLAADDSELEVESLASRGYVDLTLDTMRAFGVEAERNSDYSLFRVPGGRRYKAADFTVEGDWSGAAFLLVAGALAARREPVRVGGLDANSSQPDGAILEALRLCGAHVEAGARDIEVSRGELRAFEFDASDCPDLFPPLVVLALACEGESRIRGAARLRGKESDRAAALTEEFAELGASVAVEGDLMKVRGIGFGRGGRLRGGRVDSRGDHRIAMAAAIASLCCEAPVEIEGGECVAKSWPSFYQDLAGIAR